ncbi:MAG: hypothetical protein J5596_02105 [Bacteroidaceae bacterium]|nr:hypothetical protein [Bacteroidaceae bacterium]
MKKILCFAVALVCVTVTFAQTGAEIVNRMNERISAHESDGVSLYVDVKVPVVGTIVTKTAMRGDKRRIEMHMKDHDVITFNDKDTTWLYSVEANSVIITVDSIMAKVNSANQGQTGLEMGMFGDIPQGYDISIKSENLVKWELACKKKKGNKDSDYPKHITIEVRKETYQPISLSTKMMGITCVMRDFTFGIPDKYVTFNEADFPGVTVVDNR